MNANTSSPAAVGMRDDVVAELAAGAGDEEPGHAPTACAFSGSHQSRCSRYHSTVWARPASKSRSSFQPRAVILSMWTL